MSEFQWGRSGLELTKQQREECRVRAMVELIEAHRHEFEGAVAMHMERKLEAQRAYLKREGKDGNEVAE